jgi:hypothetical protein
MILPGLPCLYVTWYLSIILLAILLRYLISWYYFLDYPTTLKYNDETCTLVGSEQLVGSEDMAIGLNNILFITSGDLHNVFEHGTTAAKMGGIWSFDLSSKEDAQPQKLQLRGFDVETHGFYAHGLYVSNLTSRLYVVNHAVAYSGIEIFYIDYSTSPPSLQHESTVGGDGLTFPLRTINDVVEGDNEINELYVTQWLPNSVPMEGKRKKSKSFHEMLNGLVNLFVQLFGMKLTSVFKCERGTDSLWKCIPASDTRFVGSNGITISKDRSLVYINDAPSKDVSIFRRNHTDGTLTFLEKFDTIISMDNIEIEGHGNDDEVSIIMGSIPKLHQYVRNKLYHLNDRVAGGAVVAFKKNNGNTNDNKWILKRLVTHDGSKLSQISAAARYGDRIVMGSPFSNGILVCDYMYDTE